MIIVHWSPNNAFTRVTYKIACISCIYIMIHNSNKITVTKLQKIKFCGWSHHNMRKYINEFQLLEDWEPLTETYLLNMGALAHSCNLALRSPRRKTTSSQIHELQSESYPKHVLKVSSQILWVLEKMLPFCFSCYFTVIVFADGMIHEVISMLSNRK